MVINFTSAVIGCLISPYNPKPRLQLSTAGGAAALGVAPALSAAAAKSLGISAAGQLIGSAGQIVGTLFYNSVTGGGGGGSGGGSNDQGNGGAGNMSSGTSGSGGTGAASNPGASGNTPAQIAADIMNRNSGSVRAALPELNGQQLPQGQVVDTIAEMFRWKGMDISGTQQMPDGTVLILSRRVGANQPIVAVDPSGQARFGNATLSLDLTNPTAPIVATDISLPP